MRLLNTTIIKLTLVLLLGVISGFYIDIPLGLLFIGLTAYLLLFGLTYFRAKNLLFKDPLFGVVSYLLFFIIGFLTTSLHLPKVQKQHYINRITLERFSDQPVLSVSIKEVLKPDLFNTKYVATVERVNNLPAHGKILLILPRDTTNANPNVGDSFLINSELKDIPSPLNPHQFDYQRFMANRGILKQTSVIPGSLIALPQKTNLFVKAYFLRTKIISSLNKNGFQPEELAIIQALLLGQKQDISKETYNNYAAAGAIHILAVSGLHVGILLLLLNQLFSPLTRFKKGRFLKTVLVIMSLWGFAILAGLSPSVIRAVTMFSFLAIGLELNRRTSSLNSLFLSLLVLILIRPQWIFEVGFQLSYAAVLAILLIQPLLYNFLNTSNRPFRYLWGILTTTIAAQLGVLPLSLFYFHQFPGLFFLSNLVILPLLGLILGIGILVILLSLLDILPIFFTEAYRLIIQGLNNFVARVAAEEQFIFRDISFSFSEVWGFYFLIFCLILLSYSFSFRKLITALFAVIFLQSIYLAKASNAAEERLIIFHKAGKTIIGNQKKDSLFLHQSTDTSEVTSLATNYAIGEGIKKIETTDHQNIYATPSGILLVIDSTGVFPKTQIRPEYLLLTGSPYINLERYIEEIRPGMILADGSNYSSVIKRWKQTCIKKEIPFHTTGEKGALIIK